MFYFTVCYVVPDAGIMIGFVSLGGEKEDVGLSSHLWFQMFYFTVCYVVPDAGIVIGFVSLGGEKEDGDDHLESLSRPVSGERTSSHDDNESVGSAVRSGSAASGSITGNLLISFYPSVIIEIASLSVSTCTPGHIRVRLHSLPGSWLQFYPGSTVGTY